MFKFFQTFEIMVCSAITTPQRRNACWQPACHHCRNYRWLRRLRQSFVAVNKVFVSAAVIVVIVVFAVIVCVVTSIVITTTSIIIIITLSRSPSACRPSVPSLSPPSSS